MGLIQLNGTTHRPPQLRGLRGDWGDFWRGELPGLLEKVLGGVFDRGDGKSAGAPPVILVQQPAPPSADGQRRLPSWAVPAALLGGLGLLAVVLYVASKRK